MSSWTVNEENLGYVVRALGLEKPVSVHRVPSARLQTEWGYFTNARQGTTESKHYILLNEEVPTEEINRSLYHELWHCRQREDLGDKATEIYSRLMVEVGYDHHPMEREADEFAANSHGLLPLVNGCES